MHPRVFHYLICILMVKRTLLLALRSSRTAIRQSAGGGSVVKGLPAAAGCRVVGRLVFCLWSSASFGFDRVGSVNPGRGLTSNTRFFWCQLSRLGDHLTS